MNTSFRHALAVCAVILLSWPAAGPCFQGPQETEIQKAKIYLETYPLLSDTDLYCTFLIWDGALPDLRIAGAEREEILLHTDGEVVYLRSGSAQGVASGQKFLVVAEGLEVSHPLKKGEKVGSLVFRRGWISVFYVEENSAAARIEKTCGPVRVGDFLVPFELRKTVEGKNEGFVPYQKTEERLTGTIVYIENELNQAGPTNWVLVDIGREQGLRPGQQLNIFHPPAKGMPRHTVANGVVVDVQAGTATLKILSSSDAIVAGDGVEVRPPL